MEDKKAIEVLTELLLKGTLTPEEDEALRDAIGILSWTKLAASRITSLRKKRDLEK